MATRILALRHTMCRYRPTSSFAAIHFPSAYRLQPFSSSEKSTGSDPSSDANSLGPDHPIAITDAAVEDNGESVPAPIDRSKYTEEIRVRMPDMGKDNGKVLRWLKKEGDVVMQEDVLCDIETPDFVFGLKLDDDYLSILSEILVEAPSGPIPDNDVICVLLHKGKEKKEKKSSNEE
jgi:hypothetical protein